MSEEDSFSRKGAARGKVWFAEKARFAKKVRLCGNVRLAGKIRFCGKGAVLR